MNIPIDNQYLTDLLIRLVDIPSVFPGEEQVMLFLERELAGIGLQSERIPIAEGRFCLLSRIGSGNPVLCLNAHADTVPASGRSVPGARVEGGRIYGLGSADDKASVSSMIAAVRAIRESGTTSTGTIDLLISVDEEGDAMGVRTATAQGYRCDVVITGEPTGLEMVPTHCGLVFLDITTYGESTHGSMPWEGINAIDRMYELVSGLRQTVTDYPPHPLLGPGSLNLGILRGGDRPNRVPARCDASVDIRLVPPMKVDEILRRVDRYFAGWRGTAEYRITKQGSTLDTPQESPLVRKLSETVKVVRGAEPKVVGWRGWTEAEAFQSALGIDAVVFGPGQLKQAHSADEYVDLEQVRQAARIYAEMALGFPW